MDSNSPMQDIANMINKQKSDAKPRNATMVRTRYLRIKRGQQATMNGLSIRRCRVCGQLRRGHVCKTILVKPTGQEDNMVMVSNALPIPIEQSAPILSKPSDLTEVPTFDLDVTSKTRAIFSGEYVENFDNQYTAMVESETSDDHDDYSEILDLLGD